MTVTTFKIEEIDGTQYYIDIPSDAAGAAIVYQKHVNVYVSGNIIMIDRTATGMDDLLEHFEGRNAARLLNEAGRGDNR